MGCILDTIWLYIYFILILYSNTTPKEYDHDRFFNLQASKSYTSLMKNKKFIKEKDFEHLEDFFRKDIVNKVT